MKTFSYYSKKILVLLCFLLLLITPFYSSINTVNAATGDGSIDSTTVINKDTTNGASLSAGDYYSISVENIGDLNGDGVDDIVVGASQADGAGPPGVMEGEIHIHFMNIDGSIDSTVTINAGTADGPDVIMGDFYGFSIANIGDLDGDGVADIAVGAYGDDGSGINRGAVHIHFMNTDGSIDSTVEINDTTANGPTLSDFDGYGSAVTSLGDLDGDGVQDLAVGAYGDDAGGTGRGAVHIHFMNTDGSIDSTVEINDTTANGPDLLNNENYGFHGIAGIGDLDGDGVVDLAVGAPSNNNVNETGKVFIHFLNADGSIDSTATLDDDTPNGPTLDAYYLYGFAVDSLSDIDADGVDELVVGSAYDDTGGTNIGAVYIHYLNTDGSIKSSTVLNTETENGAPLIEESNYGASVSDIGDLDGNGVNDLAVGFFEDTTNHYGAVAIHFLHALPESSSSSSNTFHKDTKCRWIKPPETTWIKLEPGDGGMYLTWSQVDADKIDIYIDDGTGDFPWLINETLNDGHEFLPNVQTWQQIKVKPKNHCKSGSESEPVSYAGGGWYASSETFVSSNVAGAKTVSLPATHMVVKGDTLWGLAYYYYGDGSLWGKISSANDNVLVLEIGDSLTIPE